MLTFLIACAEPEAKDDTAVPTSTSTSTTPTPTDPYADPVWDDEHVLITSSMNRVDALAQDGSLVASWLLDELVDDSVCEEEECRAEGVTADGTGLIINYARQDRQTAGGLLRLDPGGADLVPSWEAQGWAYPHEVARQGEELVVVDAFLDAVLWVPDDAGALPDAAGATLDAEAFKAFNGHLPNGMSILEEEGTTWLMVSFRGAPDGRDQDEAGRIAMWDITDPADPELAWFYPEEGSLRGPHDPTFHRRDDRWLLVYAHSGGGPDDTGTIGIAEFTDLRTVPTYVADLQAPDEELGYPRGAVLTGDDSLIITDTPSLSGGEGAVFLASWPTDLVASGKGGVWSEEGDDQEFVPLEDLTELVGGFEQTYRSFLWVPTW